MKKIKIFLLTYFILVFTFLLVGVKTVNAAGAESTNYDATATEVEKVAYDKERINLPTTMITSFPVTVDSIYKSKLTWSTSDSSVLDTKYVEECGWVELKRDPNETKTATLTVTIENGTATETKEFTITVPKGTTIVNDITVTYSVNGSLTELTSTTVKIGKAESLLDAPAKEGYEFIGWYDNSEYTGRKYTTTLGLIKDTTLYAKYEKITVTNITVSKAPTKTEYTALETFDSTGLELKVEYNYGEPKTISEGFTVQPTILYGDTEEVVVSYGGCTTTIKVTVTPIKMTGVELVRDEVTYDGQEHNLTVTGQVPKWLQVTYSDPVKDANEEGYTVTATFSLVEGYDNSHNDYEIPEPLTATLVIHKATYDMTNVTFGNLSATYDGKAHDIKVEGLLEGITATVSYEGGNVNAGSHVATISFIGDKNYNEIENKTATLVIEKANPIVTVALGKTAPYYAGESAPKISLGAGSTAGTIEWNGTYTFVEGENTFTWKFTPTDSTNYNESTGEIKLIATALTVSSIKVTTNPSKMNYKAFETLNLEGMVVIATLVDNNTETVDLKNVAINYENDATSFRVGHNKVTITYANKSVELTGLTVEKADHDMSKVTYEGLTGAIYNKEAHEVTVDNLPTGVTATVTYKDEHTTAGSHEVVINFTVTDLDNYNAIQSVTKTLEIAKGTHDVSGITIEGKTYTYDGTAHSLEVIGTLPEGVTVSYENNGQTNVGEYTVTVRFVVTDLENYNEIETSLTTTLKIAAKSIANVTVEKAKVIVNARTFDKQTPTLVVKDGEKELSLNNDYEITSVSEITSIETGTSVTANATIAGKGNYEGTKEVTFIIELSEKVKLNEDIATFNNEYTTVDTDEVATLPVVLANGSTVQYTQLPTAITVDSDGKLSVIKNDAVQTYTVTVIITNGDEVDYVEKVFIIQKQKTYKFVKVTETPSDWSGDYLIVYESSDSKGVAFDGSLATLDATKNSVEVTIENGYIKSTKELENSVFKIEKDKDKDIYYIKSASGYYIGKTSDANGLDSNQNQTYSNTISYDKTKEELIIKSSGKAILRYNSNTGETNLRFRYYKSNSYDKQKPITLYKLVEVTE